MTGHPADDLGRAQAAAVARIQARDGCGLNAALGAYFGPSETTPDPSPIAEGTLDFIENTRREYEADSS